MRRLRVILLALVALSASGQQDDRQVTQRVNGILARMTLQEKLGQLTQLFAVIPDSVPLDERVRKGEIGSLILVTDPAEVNRLQHIAMEQSRLHIPILFGVDVIHGFHTIFPVPLAIAASWDPILMTRIQTVAAREASAAGTRWVFTPMVDIARDPRWGRIVEGAGEDPFLGSRMAQAQISGFQGPYLGSPDHVLACVKHFAGYGAADGGRDYDSSYIPEDLLRNVYLPPFHAAVEAGVGSLMTAYMDLNGVPGTGNRFLLNEILRKEWGFRGFVVSDAFAVGDLTTHGFAADPADAAYRALTAGVDMDMASKTYLEQLPKLVASGKVSVAMIDTAVTSILKAKVRLGLFEHPYVDDARTKTVFAARDHRTLARTAAQRTAVLLRNEGDLLPLKKTLSSIAVIGPLADSKMDTEGPWSLTKDRADPITVLEGIRSKAGSQVRVEYARGGEIRRRFPSMFEAILGVKRPAPQTEQQIDEEIRQAAALASRSDVAVLVLGESWDMSGENASVSTLDLPGKQQQLLEAVSATGKPVVLVLLSGRPLDIHWAASHVPAILEAWFPGTEGGNAVADLLFGDANPEGRLPVTWPRSTGQVPIYYAHNLTHQPDTAKDFTSRYSDIENSPLYPFGYGLSYTKFAYSNLKLARPDVLAGQTLYVSVDVKNTGDRDGAEVVQLYTHQQSGSTSRPVRELKDFERVVLARGETKTVHLSLNTDQLRYWSSAERKIVLEPGTFDVWVGPDAAATALHTTFRLTN